VSVTDLGRGGHWEQMLTAARQAPGARPIPGPPQFADVFQTHADFVWRALRRLGLGPADAEDALQEVFLVVYRRLEHYEERGAMRAWLFAISRQVVSHYRRGAQRSERKQQALAREEAKHDDPHDAFVRGESVALVRALLAELSEPQAMVFWLSEIEEMTMPEVATALGINLNTAYGRLRLARKRFEEMVRERTEREREPT
jgi:RNA polymerase sigma-70 factor (ECF subfamily)